MDNKKMVNSAKNLDIIAKVCGICFRIVGIACIILTLAILALGSKINATHSISLDFIKMYLTDQVNINTGYMQIYLTVGLLVVSILCFMIDFGIKLIRRILAPMKEGRPFEADVPTNLKKIAWIVLAGGAVTQVVGIVERIILMKACPAEQIVNMDVISKLEYTFTIDFTFVLAFCIVMFLSYIFSYGQILQKESDETL